MDNWRTDPLPAVRGGARQPLRLRRVRLARDDGDAPPAEPWRPAEAGDTLGYLTRERYLAADDTEYFAIGSDDVVAVAANDDVCLPILATGPDTFAYPACPDCGGAIVWAEAGSVSGSRACIGQAEDLWESRRWRDAIRAAADDGKPRPDVGTPGCGSTFADSRYHADSYSHRCALHPEGIRLRRWAEWIMTGLAEPEIGPRWRVEWRCTGCGAPAWSSDTPGDRPAPCRCAGGVS